MPEKLGQHFLRDLNIVKRIVNSAQLKTSDVVIEIGPGKGILTEELAKYAGKVIAIEIDKELSNLLNNKFSNKKNVEIINEDILKMNLSKLLGFKGSTLEVSKVEPLIKSYKVIANIPYYITAPIIKKFLESEYPPEEMILMVQKEVAERIIAKSGKMSILSVSIQYYAKPEILFYVDKEKFNPVPEVDSAVIRISNIKNQNAKLRNNFFRIVKAGFCAKRKTLVNNLSNSLHLDKKEVEEKLKKVGIGPTIRAQELNIEDWKKLSKIF